MRWPQIGDQNVDYNIRSSFCYSSDNGVVLCLEKWLRRTNLPAFRMIKNNYLKLSRSFIREHSNCWDGGSCSENRKYSMNVGAFTTRIST